MCPCASSAKAVTFWLERSLVMTGLSMLPSGAVFVSDGLHAVIKHNRSRYLMYFIIYSVD